MGPVSNGEFEIPLIPQEVPDTLEGTAADRCIGIGHQAVYGDATWQHKLLDEDDPEGAADQIAGAPVEEGLFLSGVDNCVFSKEEGKDLTWIRPVDTTRRPSSWSVDRAPSVVFGYDFDDDPLDREAKILSCSKPDCSGHNMWQTGPHHRQRAFTANYDAFTFRIENWDDIKGAVEPLPGSASIQHWFYLSPTGNQHPFISVFVGDGRIFYDADDMEPDANGVVTLDPVDAADATISCRSSRCDAWKAMHNFDGQPDEVQRELLGQARLAQLSFWNFNDGDHDIVIDGIDVLGATTVAEEIGAGNYQVNPGVP